MATVSRYARALFTKLSALFVQKNYFAAGVVLRAFLNGTEAAVKRPKIKVTLNQRELKQFTQEVTTMIKASDALDAPCLWCRPLTSRAG